ncbi:MAG: response regulator transcription factor [Campylobacterota bacterium]|nr:response regulator transcription factor [Campylobacterota bacterium]
MKRAILLLEDDTELGETIQELLEDENYEVTLVEDGNEALEHSYERKYDLYLFDINVPEIDGIELLKSLREANDKTPAIFISALVDMESISKAFKVGADDYLKKPFFPQELLIRVNAKLTQRNKNICYKNLEYNFQKRVLKKDGEVVSMGEVQNALFELFISNIGDVLAKEVLLDSLEHPSSTALRVAINKLKQRLDLDIKNVRGIGYTLEKS